ncbi:2TM domain-containing protein [Epilithonimonas sp. UC225_85]|uniref:2TM domain-containing protein n=1 Tax=Epilithonimonas sp. UC225_85 TaxID=3350167 RepID=UPI0036D405E0
MEIIDKKEDIQYQQAVKKVKKLKGFYIHLMVYIFVNIFLIILNLTDFQKGETIRTWDIWATPFFWGIGLLAHAAGVFCPGFFLGKDWEEKKIRELMEKYK